MGMRETESDKIKAAKEKLAQLLDHKSIGDYERALQSGIESLQCLGISVKEEPNLIRLLLDINRSKSLYQEYPVLKNHHKSKKISEKEALQLEIMAELCGPAALLQEDLYLWLLLQIAKLTAKRKENPYSALGYAGFAYIALRYLEEIAKAEVLVKKALASLEVYEDVRIRPMVYYILGHYVGISFTSLGFWQKKLLLAAKEAKEVDERCYYGLAYEAWSALSFESGMNLIELHDHLKEILKPEATPITLRMLQSLNLIDQSCDALLNAGPLTISHDETYYKSDCGYRMSYFTSATSLAIIDEDYEKVLKLIHEAKKDRSDMKYSFMAGRLFFNEGIAMTMEVLNGHVKKGLALGRLKQLKRLFEYKVRQNPDLYGHLYKILLGCLSLLKDEYDQGLEVFEQGIAMSVEKESYRDAALGAMLLGRHCELNKRDKSAIYYYALGADYYGVWGSDKLKEDLLEKHGFLIDVNAIASRWEGQDQLLDEQVHLEALHLLEVIHRIPEGQDIERSLGQLLVKNYQVAKLLIFCVEGEQINLTKSWYNQEEDQSEEETKDYSQGLVQRACKHQEALRITQDRNNDLLKYDAYLMDHGQGSILGIPMVFDNKSYGVVYMERDKDFTDHEEKVIQLFMDQVTYFQYAQKDPAE